MKIRTFTWILALAALGFLQGCSVATTIHFNKDFSGKYTAVLDMSEAIAMAVMFDTTGTASQEKAVEEMRQSLDSMGVMDTYNGISGIRNAITEVDDSGVVTMSFDFDHIDALNASFKAMEDKSGAEQDLNDMEEGAMDILPTDFLSGGNQSFSRVKKTMIYTFDTGDGMGLFGAEGAEDLEMMSSMLDITIDFSFDRKVKSAKIEGLSLVEQGDHIVKTRLDLSKAMDGEGYRVEITTK